MIRLTQIKLPADHTAEELKQKIAKLLRIAPDAIEEIKIQKRSLDARKKPELYYTYTVDVKVPREGDLLKKTKNPSIMAVKNQSYVFPITGDKKLNTPPVIVGTGPAGLFCGLMLARNGYSPILVERGEDVDTRKKRVEDFWKGGLLDIQSNVQFGEGGAGTFSDGKLNTLVKDPQKRNQLVLALFCEFGADASILYENKPHIGTDVLSGIVRSMRQEILRLGGQVRFSCQVTDFNRNGNQITGVILNNGEEIPTSCVILAVGHSARDTFSMLEKQRVPMSQKAFAVGLRIQHPQKMINLCQYGREEAGQLGAASYKLTHQSQNGRGVYSFCMCPGGYVVNASSEKNMLAVNGMSYHNRLGENANSALIVTVTPEDFPDTTPLGGVALQRKLETIAFQSAEGKIPVQMLGDYIENKASTALGDVAPMFCGEWQFADVRGIMPDQLNQSLIEAVARFGQIMPGFDRPDALLAGIESRTSSPVRIWRNDLFESEIEGLYPCGEGAGYAGGITSAAMDGIKVAEAIGRKYAPLG